MRFSVHCNTSASALVCLSGHFTPSSDDGLRSEFCSTLCSTHVMLRPCHGWGTWVEYCVHCGKFRGVIQGHVVNLEALIPLLLLHEELSEWLRLSRSTILDRKWHELSSALADHWMFYWGLRRDDVKLLCSEVWSKRESCWLHSG